MRHRLNYLRKKRISHTGGSVWAHTSNHVHGVLSGGDAVEPITKTSMVSAAIMPHVAFTSESQLSGPRTDALLAYSFAA